MAVSDISHSAFPASAPRGVFAALVALVQNWLDRRATASALADLSDTQLADLGLTRGDLDEMARGARPAHRI